MAAPKGNKYSPGRPVGSKNRETLLREERRAIFDAEVSRKWKEIIDQLRPEYVADQFLGKAPDKIEHSGEIKTGGELSAEVIAAAKEEMKKRMKDAK